METRRCQQLLLLIFCIISIFINSANCKKSTLRVAVSHNHRKNNVAGNTATRSIVGLCPDHPVVKKFLKRINKTLDKDFYHISDGVSIKRNNAALTVKRIRNSNGNYSADGDFCEYVAQKAVDYAQNHYLDVNLGKIIQPTPTTGRLLAQKNVARFGFGKNSFLTGFGLGFLAFGLKKLLLPIFIGAQIIKSILIAMFLPSILGSVGKLVGKGVTSFAQSSSSSNFAGGAAPDNMADFDFKDTSPQQQTYDVDSAGSDNAYSTVWTYPSSAGAASGINNNYIPYSEMGGGGGGVGGSYVNQQLPALASTGNAAAMTAFHTMGNAVGSAYHAFMNEYNNAQMMKPHYNRYPYKNKDVSAAVASPVNKYNTGSFYTKEKAEDYKVFHNIPSSSHLLANYDPFYSPLLSRMDTIFKQLSYTTEPCKERLICNMYKNPAKYAPFSNLVSVQLSRELNELRKPSSDNPEILRFFRYMKAAKDGQDGQECEVMYSECTSSRGQSESAPMVATFNDINKLVQARKAF